MNEQIIPLGILIIFIGIAIVMFGAIKSADKTNTKVAIGGFIGFIPFGFANDKRMFWILLVMMGLILFFYIFWQFRFVK